MKVILKLNDVLSKVLTGISAILVIALMVGIVVAAISRYFFDHSIASITQLSAYSLLFITFLGAPLLAGQDGHISVDVFPNTLPRKGRDVVNAVVNFASAVVMFGIAWFAFVTTVHAALNHEVDANILEMPMDWLFGLIGAGSFFTGLAFVSAGLKKIARLLQHRVAAEEDTK